MHWFSEDRKCTSYDAYGNEDSTFLERDFPVQIELIQTELLEMNDSVCQSGWVTSGDMSC